eukprot:TRINITY_DN1002_c0_g1_i1.p1 TRINITY_DN1002_c0_g1~~TRINITY_DN1002_c0_g1_i1.p1  ORF type:complete len:424 (-),score=144.94 TRINITY_DN1002_c0_g1_i1:795-1928(-)
MERNKKLEEENRKKEGEERQRIEEQKNREENKKKEEQKNQKLQQEEQQKRIQEENKKKEDEKKKQENEKQEKEREKETSERGNRNYEGFPENLKKVTPPWYQDVLYKRLELVLDYKKEYERCLLIKEQPITTLKGDIKELINKIPGQKSRIEGFMEGDTNLFKRYRGKMSVEIKKFAMYGVIFEMIKLSKRSIALNTLITCYPSVNYLVHFSKEEDNVFSLISGIISLLSPLLFLPCCQESDFKIENELEVKSVLSYSAFLFCFFFLDSPIGKLFRLEKAWTFFSNFCNQPPLYTSATVIEVFLKLGGNKMIRAFGRPFIKLMDYIEKEWMSWATLIFQKNKTPFHASFVRLKTMIEDLKKNGRFEDYTNQNQNEPD